MSGNEQQGNLSQIDTDDLNMAMLSHVLCVVCCIGFWVPLIIWLMNKDKEGKEFLNSNAKESFNFQITITLAMTIAGILSVVAIGIFLIPVIIILNIVFCIRAGILAKKGIDYRYPCTIRFMK